MRYFVGGVVAVLLVSALHIDPSRALQRVTDPVGRRTVVLGRSVEGRVIIAVEIGDLDSARKVLVVGCIHGNECAGIAVAHRLARGRPARGRPLGRCRISIPTEPPPAPGAMRTGSI